MRLPCPLAPFVVTLSATLCVLTSTASAQSPTSRTALIIQWSTEEFPGNARFDAGVRQVLRSRPDLRIDCFTEYLESDRFPEEEASIALRDYIRSKYRDRRIDVVIANALPALTFAQRFQHELFPDVPIVYLGYQAPKIGGTYTGARFTGVVTGVGFGATAALALRLHPATTHLFVVAQGPLKGNILLNDVKDVLRSYERQVALSFISEPSVSSLIAAVKAISGPSVILYIRHSQEERGGVLVPQEIAPLVAQAATVPVYGISDSILGSGIVGGAMFDSAVLSARIGDMALRVLDGTRVQDMAIEHSALTPMFDWRQLKRWRIDLTRLPPGSDVRFRVPTAWELYRGYIVGALSVVTAQALAIAALLVQRKKRRTAEAETADAEQRYRTVADFTADWEYWMRPDGTLVYVSPSCLAVTGYDAEEFKERPSLITNILCEDDRHKWEAYQQREREAPAGPGIEVRIRTKGGDLRWLEILITSVASPDGVSLGIRGSARDVTARKHAEDELRAALAEIRTLRDRLEVDNTVLREQAERGSGLDGLLGSSEVMQYVVSKVKQVAPTPSTVLLLGETGVGKSLIARAVHNSSQRRARPLVTLDCAALPPSLVESELFGHEKGAFTGAHTRRIGRFEVANGGTLFLDEIGELPLDIQGKLLRAVQDGEFVRVGSNAVVKTDVRLIVATNRQLGEEVRAGRFRQDLWYRLNVFPITLPPLRQRADDIPVLAKHFIDKHCRKLGRSPLEISKASMKVLQLHTWPGNVRELENVIERAAIVSRGAYLDISDEDLRVIDLVPRMSSSPAVIAARTTLKELERAHIVATLQTLHWRVDGAGGAADVLGINASTLRSRMRKLGIHRPGSPPATEVAH